jgi:phosphoesterase RecJ-like protein
MLDWSRFVELVRSHQRFLLTSHIRPDCDALGSELALAAILEQLGKEVLVVNGQATPPGYLFLDPKRKLKELGADVTLAQLEPYEVLIVLDTSAWAQLGPMGDVLRTSKAKKLVIDHHVSGDDLGAELLTDNEAEAAGRLVIEAADALGATLTLEIAQAAFVALATDTGWFRFSSTTSGTLRLAARLMDAGLKPDELYQKLYQNDTLARLQLVGRSMARTKIELDGRLIHTFIERADFEATGALPSDSEDIINLTLSVQGTEAAVIFVEQPTGGFKISFRSRNDLDCSRLAQRFGGGGHKKAAGAFVDEPLASAQAKVLDAVRAAMR